MGRQARKFDEMDAAIEEFIERQRVLRAIGKRCARQAQLYSMIDVALLIFVAIGFALEIFGWHYLMSQNSIQ